MSSQQVVVISIGIVLLISIIGAIGYIVWLQSEPITAPTAVVAEPEQALQGQLLVTGDWNKTNRLTTFGLPFVGDSLGTPVEINPSFADRYTQPWSDTGTVWLLPVQSTSSAVNDGQIYREMAAGIREAKLATVESPAPVFIFDGPMAEHVQDLTVDTQVRGFAYSTHATTSDVTTEVEAMQFAHWSTVINWPFAPTSLGQPSYRVIEQSGRPQAVSDSGLIYLKADGVYFTSNAFNQAASGMRLVSFDNHTISMNDDVAVSLLPGPAERYVLAVTLQRAEVSELRVYTFMLTNGDPELQLLATRESDVERYSDPVVHPNGVAVAVVVEQAGERTIEIFSPDLSDRLLTSVFSTSDWFDASLTGWYVPGTYDPAAGEMGTMFTN